MPPIAILDPADLVMSVNDPPDTNLDPDTAAIAVTYSVSNTGADPATSTTFVASRPAGSVGDPTAVITDGPDAGAAQDWVCDFTSSPVDCTLVANSGTLAPGATVGTVTLTFTVDTAGSKTMSAAASTATPESDASDDTDSTEVTVTDAQTTATLGVVADPSEVEVTSADPGIVTVTYTATNTGTQNIRASLTVHVPTGTVLTSLTGPGCPVIGGPQTSDQACDLGVLAKGDPGLHPALVDASFEVTRSAFASYPGIISFAATMTPTKGTVAGAPLQSNDVVTATQAAVDLSIDDAVDQTFTANGPTDNAAAGAIYLTTRNNGPEASEAKLVLAPDRPSAVSYTDIPSGCAVTAGQRLDCTTGLIGPGSTESIVPGIQIDEAGPVQMTVAVEPTNPGQQDPNLSNNSDQFTLTRNRPPAAIADDAPPLPGAGRIDVAVLANDTDADGDVVTLTGAATATPGALGLLSIVNGNAVRYQPPAGFVGLVDISYTVTDGRGGLNNGSLLVRVIPPLYAVTPTGTSVDIDPLAATLSVFNATAPTAEGSPNAGTVASAPNGSGLALAGSSQLGHPLVEGAGNAVTGGKVRYFPASGFTSDPLVIAGQPDDPFVYDDFAYTAVSPNATVVGTIRVRVTNAAPSPAADDATVADGLSVTIVPRANDADPNVYSGSVDGNPFAINDTAGLKVCALAKTLPASNPCRKKNSIATPFGTASLKPNGKIVFKAKAGVSGIAHFGYVVSDGRGGMAFAPVTVTVT